LQGVCRNREDQKELTCPECWKALPTRRHLQEHRRTKHRQVSATAVAAAPQNMGHSLGQYFSSYVPHTPNKCSSSAGYPPEEGKQPELPAAVIGHQQHHHHQQQQQHQNLLLEAGRCDPCPTAVTPAATTAVFPSQSVESQQYFGQLPSVQQHQHHTVVASASHHHQHLQSAGSVVAVGDALAASVMAAGVPGASADMTSSLLPPMEPLEENVGSLLRQVYSTEHSDYSSAACRGGQQLADMSFMSYIFDYC
jgi:hypothetical protein